MLTIGGFLYPIGLKTLQDVFAFLKEIDAYPMVPQPVALTDGERKALQRCVETTVEQIEQRVTALLNPVVWRKPKEEEAGAVNPDQKNAFAHGMRNEV